ncbi:rhodanese-like domain-containing protein [Hyphomonas sp.]|uniref:rhodanese-like domain-containing protein n=1 Tax=Hyphomonas sp. TaxID=87 RepID=UPI003527FDC9
MTSCMTVFVAETSPDVVALSAKDAAYFHNRAGVEFVDLRPAEMIAETTGIIPGARNISLADIEAGRMPPAFDDRSIHVITTCLAGPTAARAADLFAKMGFARVSYIDGGTRAWLEAGMPTHR